MIKSAAGSSVWEPGFIALTHNRKQQIGPKMSELHAGPPPNAMLRPFETVLVDRVACASGVDVHSTGKSRRPAG